MAKDRQELISQKLAAAQQRRMRTAFLKALPEPVRIELEPALVLFEPNNSRVRCLASFSARGFEYDMPTTPDGFAFREFSWPEQLFAALAVYPERHDGVPAYLQPFGVRAFAGLSIEELWNREAPAFSVGFGWARQNLAAIFEATQHGLALVSESFEVGIVISVVCGYLEVDPNPHERIYELATWG
ncbi:MAG: hypothetical protein HZA46_21295 [Planctomycetales bacterium]|nr:hypothetical protein [Planctomycetales bacterium]